MFITIVQIPWNVSFWSCIAMKTLISSAPNLNSFLTVQGFFLFLFFNVFSLFIFNQMAFLSFRTWPCHGYIWAAGLHSQWGEESWDVSLLWSLINTRLLSCGHLFLNKFSVIPTQPPPKLPHGVFTADFQDFVTKWWITSFAYIVVW